MSARPGVIVSWRPDHGPRDRLWQWVRRRWWGLGLPVTWADSDGDPFTRGQALNRAAERSEADPLIVADADTVVTTDVVGLARDWSDDRWAVAYEFGGYCALNPSYTEVLLNYDPAATLPTPTVHDLRARIESHSGCLIIPRLAWSRVGGYDPRFCGWGYEDDALFAALRTLWGEPERPAGLALHLYHEHVESERFEQPHITENRALADRYAAASYSGASDMLALISERDREEVA